MTTAQLRQNGFDVLPDDPDKAVSRLYPHFSVRHRCKECGNWSSAFNGKCPQCFVGKEPLAPTKQYYKLYLGCCADDNCSLRQEALGFLASQGMETKWLCHDGFGSYVSLAPAKEWDDEQQFDLFSSLNEYSVSKFGARLLSHPGSKRRSKLPKKG